MITSLNIIGDVIDALRRDELTQAQMLAYCEQNAQILKANLEQALIQNQVETVAEVLREKLSRYLAEKERILANYATFSQVAGRVTDAVTRAYGHDLPEIVLVPCLGLYSNGGWRELGDGCSYICVALERLAPGVQVDILLAHEIAHGLAETKWDTVLDGFYGEGHATYVSSVLCPGHPEEAYFFSDRAWLDRCLDWIEANRERIRRDAPQPLQVLNPYHKLYLSTSFNPETPNIGYLIGALYLKHLHQEHTLHKLRTFGRTDQPNQEAFAAFISGWQRDDAAGA